MLALMVVMMARTRPTARSLFLSGDVVALVFRIFGRAFCVLIYL